MIIASILWASSGVAGKVLILGGISPFELVQIRITLSAVIFWLGLLFRLKSKLRIRLSDLPFFVLLGGVAFAINNGGYFYTISKLQVAAAILLQYLAPFFVVTYSIFFWKDRITASKLISLIIAFGGCYFVVGGYNLDVLRMNTKGILSGLLSAVCFAGYSLLGEWGMRRYSPWVVLCYALIFGAITWHIIYPPFHYLTAGFTLIQWGWIFYIATVGTILPFGLFFVGIKYIRSTRASIIATLEPISAGFFAYLLLEDTMHMLQLVGGAMIVAAIVLLKLSDDYELLTPTKIRAN